MKTNKKLYKYGIFIIVILIIIFSIIQIQKLKQISNKDINAEEISISSSNSILSEKDKIRINEKIKKYPKAIELVDPDGFINIDNITIKDNVGKKVILVDFWTYSCINCQRTTPYLNAWYKKYEDKGLIIIGVHTPEFDFEKDYENVKRAVEKFNINYPVVQDNEYKTWHAYKNRYWPRKYIIDIDGFIVYDHIGEGAYEETEKKIQDLLEERKNVLESSEKIGKDIVNPDIKKTDFSLIDTSEIYFGYGFSRNQIGNKEGWNPEKSMVYSLPEKIEENKFYLSGEWFNNKDNMELKSEKGSIILKYSAKRINLVAGSKSSIQLNIRLDGKEVNKVEISKFDLYNLIDSESYGKHTIEIESSSPGLIAYTFTFG